MRKLFTVLVASVILTLAAAIPARAGKSPCAGDACKVLESGHARDRIPVACVSIPFVKRGYGKIAMFVMRDFDPSKKIEDQLQNVLFPDSKVTGPVDDFCRNPKYFVGAHWVVLCDEQHRGWITGGSLQYAIHSGRPQNGRRVHVGSF